MPFPIKRRRVTSAFLLVRQHALVVPALADDWDCYLT